MNTTFSTLCRKTLSARLPAALLILCFLFSLSPRAGKVHAESGRADPPRITVLGDSISEGYGLDGFVRGSGNPAVASYGNLVARELGSAYEKEYFNLSVSGDTSADLLALIEEKGDELKAQAPDLIFITIGGNDLIHAATEADRKLFGDGGILSSLFSRVPENAGGNAGGGLSSDGASMEQLSELRLVGSELKLRIPGITSTFGENLSACILALHTLAPEAQIYVQTIYDPLLCTDRSSFLYTTLSVASSIVSPLLEQMNAVITALAATLDYTVVDAASAFEKAGGCPVTNILSFDIHPNADGHALLAKLVLEAVEKNRPKGTDSAADSGNTGVDKAPSVDAVPSPDGDSVSVYAGDHSPVSPDTAGDSAAGDGAADGGETGRKILLCLLLALVTAAGCGGVVLLYRRHRSQQD